MAFVRVRTQKAGETKGNPCVKFSLTFIGDAAAKALITDRQQAIRFAEQRPTS
jgi:hypothetical protein